MSMRFILFVLCSAMLVVACGGGNSSNPGNTNNTGNTGPGGTTTTLNVSGNTFAVLSGEQVGNQIEDNAVLSKSLTFNQPSSDLQIERATISRDKSTNTLNYMAIEVTNISQQLLCGITFGDMAYEMTGMDGVPVTVYQTTGAVMGSIGEQADGTRVSGCLAPGQTGFVLDGFPQVNTFTYDNVSSVVISNVTVVVADHIAPITVMPLSYAITGTSATGSVIVNVSVQNKSGASETVNALASRYLLLDANGAPLTWGYIINDPTTDPLTYNMTSGETVQMPGAIFFAGSAAKMLVMLDVK